MADYANSGRHARAFRGFGIINFREIMNIAKNKLPKSQIELTVEMGAEEFAPYIRRGAEAVSREVKIEGFRPGKVPFDILKKKIGEMTILEEAARIAIDKTIGEAIGGAGERTVGSPGVDIIKLAPGNPFVYKITMAMLPEITLGDYKNIRVKRPKPEFKEEEVEKMINDLREMRTKESIVERAAREGDKVVADIEMFLDKVPVEGGQSRGAAVILGKNYVVPGFDKHLVGAGKGDVREFSLAYPADFHMKNLSGKMVEFRAAVKEVYGRELPAADDNLAAAFGMKKIEELRENVRKSMLAQKEKEAEQATEREMLEKIVGRSRFGDIPEILVNHEVGVMLSELEQAVAQQGGKFDDYLSSLNKTRDQLTLDMLPEAVKRVKTSLLIREIASVENITIKDEEVDKQVKEMKEYYRESAKNSPEAREMLKRADMPEYKNYVSNILSSRKVIERLKSWNLE